MDEPPASASPGKGGFVPGDDAERGRPEDAAACDRAIRPGTPERCGDGDHTASRQAPVLGERPPRDKLEGPDPRNEDPRNEDPSTTQPEPAPDIETLDQAASVFVELQPRLFGIAYRVLGSVVEAEDVVQEVWLRWQKCDRSAVLSPVAFLSTTTTRLAINVAQSARVRRETYIGPWLPEPIDTSSDPEAGAQQAESLELALLLVLERLKPTERAAYVLREAFDYGYPEIAEILQLSLVNARKIVSRARKHLLAEQRETVDSVEHKRLLRAFVSASRTGDLAPLEALFTPELLRLPDRDDGRGTLRAPVPDHEYGGARRQSSRKRVSAD